MRLFVFGAELTDPLVLGGSVTLLLGLAGYLLKELSKSSGGAWRVVREKNREIHRLQYSERFWQHQALPDQVPDPGTYIPPTEEELSTW